MFRIKLLIKKAAETPPKPISPSMSELEMFQMSLSMWQLDRVEDSI